MSYTDAGNKATQKYKKKNYKRIPLEVTKENYEQIKSHSQARKETVNGFIKRAINETIERDNNV